MASQMKGAKVGLTKKEIDPDFKGTHQDWVTQYGHIPRQGQGANGGRKDRQTFSELAFCRAVFTRPLAQQVILKVGTFTPWNIANWIKKADKRSAGVSAVRNELLKQRLFAMIAQAHQSIELWPSANRSRYTIKEMDLAGVQAVVPLVGVLDEAAARAGAVAALDPMLLPVQAKPGHPGSGLSLKRLLDIPSVGCPGRGSCCGVTLSEGS